jgi:hypothetical protein
VTGHEKVLDCFRFEPGQEEEEEEQEDDYFTPAFVQEF